MSVERTDLERFRSLVARRLGLQYEDGKLDYLAEVVRRRMELTGSTRFESYFEYLDSSPKRADELRALAENLTVNETFFFRNADNFRAVVENVLPERIRARSSERRLRILSAGCASGEEPYSLAIRVREVLPDPDAWDVKILGVDVNAAVLAKAREARFSEWSLRATDGEDRRRYFRAEGRDFVLVPEIRKMVAFEERNLVDDDALFWRALACDVVFCRNVLMYFAPEKAREVVLRIGDALLPGGFFFLGHAETLRGLSSDFHLCHTHDTFYYRRRGASETVSATATWIGPPREDAGALPPAVEATNSWVEVIQQASDRITALATRGAAEPPLSPSTTTAPVRTWDLGLVLEAVRQERFSDALELLSALPSDGQSDPDVLLIRAVLLTNNGRLGESEEVCRRLLSRDELNAGAHYLVALCREHAGDPAAAIEHDEIAAYLDAGFAMPRLHLGLMALRRGDTVAAQRELGQAILLLAREDASRLVLFGGGFSRDTLLQLCRTELRAAGGDS